MIIECKGSFLDKVEYLLKRQGVTKREFCSDLGIGINSFSNWRAGSVPNKSTVMNIATYFGLIPESLIDPDRKIETIGKQDPDYLDTLLPLDEEEAEIVMAYRSVSDKTKVKIFMAIMKICNEEDNV